MLKKKKKTEVFSFFCLYKKIQQVTAKYMQEEIFQGKRSKDLSQK